MRYPIFALTAIAAITCLAPERAYAGDPEADKRIYDAFEKYMKTVPNEKKDQEYKKFLEWYPTNVYAPTVKKEYEAFAASQALATTTTNTPPQNNNGTGAIDPAEQAGNQGGYGISTNNNGTGKLVDGSLPFDRSSAPVDPMEEAAGAVDGGIENDAAAALDGAVVSDPTIPTIVPTNDIVPGPVALRRPKSFGVGADFALSAFIGPGVLVDYTTLTSRWTVGGALRAPAFQTVQFAFEARRFLSPERPLSAYLGGTFGTVAGNINAVFGLVDLNFQGTSARSATSFGALAGVQKMKPDGNSYYLELSYQFLLSETNDQAGFPGASIGYRYFFNSTQTASSGRYNKFNW
jgi:hypothetical protein